MITVERKNSESTTLLLLKHAECDQLVAPCLSSGNFSMNIVVSGFWTGILWGCLLYRGSTGNKDTDAEFKMDNQMVKHVEA